MPHVNSGGSEDFFSNDEVKVYKDEGEEEKRSSENLSEDKLGLVTETEEGKNNNLGGSYAGNEKEGGREDGKGGNQGQDRNAGGFGYSVPYQPYPNGTNNLGSKVSMVQPPLPGFVMYNSEHLSQPPPAHMGIPPMHIDPKTGLPRPPMYAYPSPSQFPPGLYGPDLSQVQWPRQGYPISSGAFTGAYPPSLLNSSALSRFGHPGLFPPPGISHPGMPHPSLMSPANKQDGGQQPHGQDRMHDQGGSGHSQREEQEKKKPHIKKPLNAFMLFMKEQRAKVVAECTLKESAAINQILGRKWHALDRSEQTKYYEMARKEKELHLQLYPGWSARDNYAAHTKKKRKKRDPQSGGGDCTIAKKCRARYGLEQQGQWCKPCRRKKKCIRYMLEDGVEYITDGEDGPMSDDVTTGDSVHDSDSMVGSPLLSVTSDDAFSTPSKSFCQNSPPSGLDLGDQGEDLDVTIKPIDNGVVREPLCPRSLDLNDSRQYGLADRADLNVTLTM
ncbi:transcription factor 7-like 2 isoform X1 [Argopecten irradians]|uniref:transcription factor 7-like 2 isoform X1 n=1 Tax=Argopecten irradians TaxID=31199 RepID=UPI00371F3DBD